ncbi:MAG: patatin-like phospholipase family protein [Clostridiaceae bacterium]
MLGLALEGGGAKGAYHMGVVKAYYEEGFTFDGIVGTSIGALNGAIIAQGDFELGYEWWGKMDTSFLFNIDQVQIQKVLNKNIDKEVLVYLYTKITEFIDNKGLDTIKIRETLDTLISEDKIRNSEIDFGLVTVSVSDLKPLELFKEDIPIGKITAYLMASANFPLFKIEPMDGKFYIDGGFYDNCPINLLIRKGYKEIIAVRTLGMGLKRKLEDESVKITNIIPSEDLGMVLNFNQNLIDLNLKRGYFDAMRVIKGLKGKKYYIESTHDDYIYNVLLSMPDDTIYELKEIMHLHQMEPKRLLFEQIIPAMSHLLGLPSTASYQDIIIGILEFSAEDQEIDRFSINSFESLIRIVKSNINEFEYPLGSDVFGLNKFKKYLPDMSKNNIMRQTTKVIVNYLNPELFKI